MSASKKTYILKLYVAGNTPSSTKALRTLNTILEEEFQGVYALKVIDVLKNPQLAEEDKILATPTLAKILPPPVRKIIGDLSDRERVLIGLDLLYDELRERDEADQPWSVYGLVCSQTVEQKVTKDTFDTQHGALVAVIFTVGSIKFWL